MQQNIIPSEQTGLIRDVITNAPGAQVDRGLYSYFDKTCVWLNSTKGSKPSELYLPVYKATGEDSAPFVITFKEPIHGMDIKCTLPKGKPGKVRSLAYLDTDPYPEHATLTDSTAVPVESPNFDVKIAIRSPGPVAQIVRVVLFRQLSDEQQDTPAPVNDVIWGSTNWIAEVPTV